MKQGVDYDLVEHGEDQWSILYQDIEFVIDELSFDEYEDENIPQEVEAKIKYTIISDNKPEDTEEFDTIVGYIVQSILEDMSQELEEDCGEN